MSTLESDFLVIGSGIAGLVYALDASKYGSVLVLSKGDLSESNTRYAQGGIASVTEIEDDFSLHIKDTLLAGAGLCKENAVSQIIESGPDAISFLSQIGVRFDTLDGTYSLGKEGGHSKRRILHWGDQTGAEIQRALLKAAMSNPQIRLLSEAVAIDLVSGADQEILGAHVFLCNENRAKTFLAQKTCIATGGLGRVYLYTSNPDLATGDGVAMAYRQGAVIENMEFIQFHPTCLYHARARNFLITEAMRGEGAVLIDQQGNRFMNKYHENLELAPRDIVARAIDNELKKSGDEYVFLDITSRDESFLKERFPNIYTTLLSLGINIAQDPIPVVPAAHYSCGGIKTDLDGRTNLENMYAIGEVACTGLHGANRLASNSLLEAVVLGRKAAQHAGASLDPEYTIPEVKSWDDLDTRESDEAVLISHIWDEVRRTMWNLVGIVRNTKRLKNARKRLLSAREEVSDYYWNYRIEKDLLELRNIVDVAILIVEMAISREESRGLHYNSDFPFTLDTAKNSQSLISKT